MVSLSEWAERLTVSSLPLRGEQSSATARAASSTAVNEIQLKTDRTDVRVHQMDTINHKYKDLCQRNTDSWLLCVRTDLGVVTHESLHQCCHHLKNTRTDRSRCFSYVLASWQVCISCSHISKEQTPPKESC